MTELGSQSSKSDKSVSITGVSYATCCSGTKYKNRDDLVLIVLDSGSNVCGCFTVSTMPSAPVIWSKKNIKKANNLKQKSILLINAGNANAFTGKDGLIACEEKALALANAFKCDKKNIFFASTGVIGEKLPHEKIIQHFDFLKENLSSSSLSKASNAILTTDLTPKTYTSKFKICNQLFTITGFAKGSGMIYPNMATMLAFIFTDFAIDSETLSSFTRKAVDESFNKISVDGDTSTSDSVFVSTTNKKSLKITRDKMPEALNAFYNEIKKAMVDLAKKIVMDGEGASKFIEITVSNARSIARAKKICFSIANSLLVKTAIAGEDANWGRLVMAIGKTQINLNIEKIKIYIQDFLLCQNGQGIETVDETSLSRALKKKKVDILVDLAEGNKDFTAWTSDLTEDYIRINADYRS
ncbi:bifunctional glutamate N-acetyltransferase/amino-acid acetyltransferase ArgJ [Paracoccaceae bacterium]|nr:bifunctional glutamate N-acetyltransferase/amino-acid acetyltransferase ArgJ [Paracoccaceae bacterium]